VATVAIAAIVVVSGCGDSDFKGEARAPVPLAIDGAIHEKTLDISPLKNLGAGPFQITISNQTQQAHTITLEGERLRYQAGSVAPLDTITINKTLEPGRYEVRAGEPQAVTEEIKPAVLTIGKERTDSNADLELP
jgi:hypothetical protein